MSPQTGPDLVGAGYPISRPLTALLGGQTQTANPNFPARSNLELFPGPVYDTATVGTGYGPWTDPGAAGTTASVFVATPVPVVPGDVITSINGYWSGIAGSSFTHLFGALYTGTPYTSAASPTLISQTVDYTGSVLGSSNFAAITSSSYAASNAPFSMSFSSTQTITSINAPYGYVYALIGAYYSACVMVPLNVQCGSFTPAASGSLGPWGANAPAFFCGSVTGGASVAPSSLAFPGNRYSYAPVVILK